MDFCEDCGQRVNKDEVEFLDLVENIKQLLEITDKKFKSDSFYMYYKRKINEYLK